MNLMLSIIFYMFHDCFIEEDVLQERRSFVRNHHILLLSLLTSWILVNLLRERQTARDFFKKIMLISLSLGLKFLFFNFSIDNKKKYSPFH